MKRPALGRGIKSLLPDEPKVVAPAADSDRLLRIGIDRVRPNSRQPRRTFAKEELAELTASIREHGILQPVIVRAVDDGYELIAGERRWRAAQAAGLQEVPAVVQDVDEGQLLELALIENVQRHDLNPIEEANAYRRLMTERSLGQVQVAERVGKKRSTVANALRLLELPTSVAQQVETGELSAGHAKCLLAIKDPEAQERLARETIERELSVRALESAVRALTRSRQPREKKDDPNVRDASERLTRKLGARVMIKARRRGGTIAIEYADDEELDRLYELLMGRSR